MMRVPAIGTGVLRVILASGIGLWVLAAQAMPASVTAPGAFAESSRIGHSPQVLLAHHFCGPNSLDNCRERWDACRATGRSTTEQCNDRFHACSSALACVQRGHGPTTYQQPGDVPSVPVRRPAPKQQQSGSDQPPRPRTPQNTYQQPGSYPSVTIPAR